MTFGYAAALLLLLRVRRFAGPLQRGLGSVGRTALSNYLLQSVIATTLCYGYGLGAYGRIGPAAGLAVAVGIFLVQVAASRLWLLRFQRGPVESLWRVWTYWTLASAGQGLVPGGRDAPSCSSRGNPQM
jgi:uncharacterized protein